MRIFQKDIMKKILFVVPDMEIGGIQKSLAQRLCHLPEDVEATVFCLNRSGPYLRDIPKTVKVLSEDPYAKLSQISLCECKKMGYRCFFLRLFLSGMTKCFGKALPAFLITRKVRNLGEYDVAISYAQPAGARAFYSLTNEIVLSCTKAKTKGTFLHADFGSYGGNCRYHRKLYQKFDWIAAVSKSVGKRFSALVPNVFDKIITVYNILDLEKVRKLAGEQSVCYPSFSFVTVARLSREKGLLRCLPLMERLRQEGYRFEWHIIGSGELYTEILSEIQKRGLEKTVILEGLQENPYRFMKYADVLFLPSFHEAAPMIFEEAAALSLRILTTNTLSAKELVADRGLGIVCENTEEDIYLMLKREMDKKKYED